MNDCDQKICLNCIYYQFSDYHWEEFELKQHCCTRKPPTETKYQHFGIDSGERCGLCPPIAVPVYPYTHEKDSCEKFEKVRNQTHENHKTQD